MKKWNPDLRIRSIPIGQTIEAGILARKPANYIAELDALRFGPDGKVYSSDNLRSMVVSARNTSIRLKWKYYVYKKAIKRALKLARYYKDQVLFYKIYIYKLSSLISKEQLRKVKIEAVKEFKENYPLQ